MYLNNLSAIVSLTCGRYVAVCIMQKMEAKTLLAGDFLHVGSGDGVRTVMVWLVHVCGCKSIQFTILHILRKQSVVKTSLLHSSESNLYLISLSGPL